MHSSILNINNVTLKVANRQQPVLANINYTVYANDFIVLLGSNGSGKSSIIKLINKVYKPTEGTMHFLGKSLESYQQKVLAQHIITLTQSTHDNLFLDMTIMENAILWELRTQSLFSFSSKQQRREQFKAYIADFSAKLASHLDMPVANLSGGEQQILILALCLRYPPQLLLLDEHTSALDPKTASLMMEKTFEAIHQRKITCLMTTHNLDFAVKYGNRLIAIREGSMLYEADHQEKERLDKEKILHYCYG